MTYYRLYSRVLYTAARRARDVDTHAVPDSGERAGVSRSSGPRVAVPAFASPERPGAQDSRGGRVCHHTHVPPGREGLPQDRCAVSTYVLYRLRAACFAQRARAFTDLAPRITRAKVRYPPCNPPSPWISPPYNGHSAGVRWAPRVVKGVDRGGLGGESSAWRRCQAPVRGEPHPPRQSQRCAVPPAMGRGGARALGR